MTSNKSNSTHSNSEGRVLIVDDEPDVCFLISSMLRSTNCKTSICHSLGECRKELESFGPTHIILDINLPDGNGLEMLANIRKSHPEMKVIMHSALDTKENRSKADQLGAAGFLKKPINKQLLFERLNLPYQPK